MEFYHKPVLFQECIENLDIKPDGIYVDGTLGGAGHAKGIANLLSPKGTLVGIDRDADAIAQAGERLEDANCNLVIVKGNYADIKGILSSKGIDRIDGALLDIGVSSYQLDNLQRGFSYMGDAPLDMRMDRDEASGAYDIINAYDEKELTRVIRDYGEERYAARIARSIVREREQKPIETTGELVEIIRRSMPAAAKREKQHPAKRTFQAIRIEVNDELGGLARAVEDFCDVLKPGGRLAIITFHSLEDRIVKDIFARRENPCTCPKEIPVCVCGLKPDIRRVTRKPIIASPEEVQGNPRARSAKLRVCEKL